MRRIITLLSVILLFIATTSAANSPQRIVSLSSSLTQQLVILGVEDQLVGVSEYCVLENNDKEIVVSNMTVNVEKVLRLKPDLVLATSLVSSKNVGMLRKLGLEVEILELPQSFEQICAEYITIGKLVGKETLAQETIDKVEADLKIAQEKIPAGASPSVFLEIGAKPLFTATRNTFMDDFITQVGGRNIAGDLDNGLYSREEVIRQNPDVIIIVTMGIVGAEEKKSWSRFKGIKAADNDAIFVYDSDKICSPTPQSFVEAVDHLIEMMYY